MSKRKQSMTKDKQTPSQPELPGSQVTLYPAWCKRCGNCVAFCPRNVFETDQWGYPRVAHPELCVSCHLCEMLCPDFALSVGDRPPRRPAPRASEKASPSAPASHVSPEQSPERTAPVPEIEEHADD
jgi:2-oxoglutarate ferredoxin oxidoreductase subunit delta